MTHICQLFFCQCSISPTTSYKPSLIPWLPIQPCPSSSGGRLSGLPTASICGTVTRARPKSGLSKEIRVTTGKNSNEVHLVGQWTCQSINTQKVLVPQRLMHLLKFKPLTSPSEWQWASHIKLKKKNICTCLHDQEMKHKSCWSSPTPSKRIKSKPSQFLRFIVKEDYTVWM